MRMSSVRDSRDSVRFLIDTSTITCTTEPKVWHFSAFHYQCTEENLDLFKHFGSLFHSVCKGIYLLKQQSCQFAAQVCETPSTKLHSWYRNIAKDQLVGFIGSMLKVCQSAKFIPHQHFDFRIIIQTSYMVVAAVSFPALAVAWE